MKTTYTKFILLLAATTFIACNDCLLYTSDAADD